MILRNENEALCVAVEMERRAIRVYERALMLTEDASVRAGIGSILADEEAHLCRFQAMQARHPIGAGEERQLIAAMGADVLFPGGVMDMKRQDALSSLEGLYRYAAASEAEAVRKYSEFAEKCQDEAVRDAFLSIVREESGHLVALRKRCEG